MAGGDSAVEKVIGALVSNIWEAYELEAAEPFGADNLNTLIFECEVRFNSMTLFILLNRFCSLDLAENGCFRELTFNSSERQAGCGSCQQVSALHVWR
jgi:hypothetical protein